MRAYFIVPPHRARAARWRDGSAEPSRSARSADDCALRAGIGPRSRWTTRPPAQAGAAVTRQPRDELLAMLGHELRNPLAPIVTVR
jgi:hypothetical protein